MRFAPPSGLDEWKPIHPLSVTKMRKRAIPKRPTLRRVEMLGFAPG
jgi:hypothetical protein